MKLSVAAAVWILTERTVKGVEKTRDAAADVLKAYFRRTGRHSYRGITYTSEPREYLAADLVRASVDPKRLLACTRTTRRESLHLPPGSEPIVPSELSALLDG